MVFQTFLLHIEKKNNSNLTLGLLHSYCSCVLELLLLLKASLTAKTEVCPQICALGTCVAFEKAAHLRHSSNCLIVGEEIPKLQGCLFVYSVFFRLLGLQPLRYPTSQAFAWPQCLIAPWIQPSADPTPFPLPIFTFLSLVQGGLSGFMCLLQL